MLVIFITYLANVSRWIESAHPYNTGLGEDVSDTSQRIVGGSILLIFILMVIAVLFAHNNERFKFSLFSIMATVLIGSTLVLVTSGVYLNLHSDSGGLTKRQAGIEFWVCGNEINPVNPVGVSNKVGSSTLYEQNDNLIHLEGVVVNENIDGTLGKFMHEIGGAVLNDALIIPVNPDDSIFVNTTDGDGPASPYAQDAEKFLTLVGNSRYIKTLNGQFCRGQTAQVQVFAYTFDEESNTYEQTKINNPQNYIFSDKKNVPPGDCLIVEFDTPKNKTDKLCKSYGEIDSLRCTEFGVSPDDINSCTAHQLNYSPIGSGADPNSSKEVSQ